MNQWTARRLILILVLAPLSCAFAQNEGNVVYRSAGAIGGAAWGGFDQTPGAPVEGAPYTATVTNESTQILADGNRIVQTSSGTTARDGEGRTRRDTALPAIGDLSAANAPHLVFIHDPVAQTSYILNLTDKTAQKVPMPPLLDAGVPGIATVRIGGPPPLPPPPGQAFFFQKIVTTSDQAQATRENLGSQTMEGVLVNGVRTTRTIPAGQIGNDKPIRIVTEVWTSPDLKTVVYSKRSDPRMGEQTFKLTNIERGEPDPSLFTVPPDFKTIDGSQLILYRQKQ